MKTQSLGGLGKFFREKYLNLRHCNDIEIHSLPNTKRLKVYVMPTQIAQRNVRQKMF